MAKQKRYTSREEIVSLIDKTKEVAKERSLQMEEHKRSADECFKASAKEKDAAKRGRLIVEAEENRLKERKLVRLNSRLEKKLQVLKQTLSAFDTEILPGQTDRAVVLQK